MAKLGLCFAWGSSHTYNGAVNTQTLPLQTSHESAVVQNIIIDMRLQAIDFVKQQVYKLYLSLVDRNKKNEIKVSSLF